MNVCSLNMTGTPLAHRWHTASYILLGSIHVSNILNGKCLAKINARDDDHDTQFALQDVTALYYNEERNEIYTGTKSGHLHVWSN